MPKRKREEEASDEEAETEIEYVEFDKEQEDRPVEDRYTKVTPIEHILQRPETYIGQADVQEQEMWVYDDKLERMVFRNVKYTPGLFKIFDEILVNAADNAVRDDTQDTIKVDIDPEEGSISVYNNGKGIPVEIHKEHNVYVPSMIFGELLTGSNFDDNRKRVTGGRNGYGAKLANIFSTEFSIEITDEKGGKKLKQTWRKNMGEHDEPKITKATTKGGYTKVTFKPDLSRFKLDKLEGDIISLMKKRTYDIAGTSAGKLSVHFNGKKIKMKNFSDYVNLYFLEKPKIVFKEVNDRWSVAVGVSDGSFQQVSFVNSISTSKGGKHVSYIESQVTKQLLEYISKKNKSIALKPAHVKNYLFIFINCKIVNPTFDSQTKENMTLAISKFGSKCKLDDEFLKKLYKIGITEKVLDFAKSKESSMLKKKSGKKTARMSSISKLDDANDAGSKHSDTCTLILTEGDSAKTLAVSGLGVVGRDRYGVFPLKGKVMNVRDAAVSKVMGNEEIENLIKIMGLKFKTDYTKETIKTLRYGSIMIMADQDHDGSHIKGLLLNFIHYYWPSLMKIPGFVKEFITPILKTTHKRTKKVTTFFTIAEYEKWKQNVDLKQYTIKYYKGLGTSTAQEAKEYFSNLKTHQIQFQWETNADEKFDIAFNKTKADARKDWLNAYEEGTFVDHSKGKVKLSEFFDKELVQFAIYDNSRSIPSIMDGLKPGQRKILYCCFKRNLKKEIKVAQLVGYVAEHSAYHHGEQSLSETIVNMAQDFVGSNNVNLLYPSGQFGTRLHGGDDAASARYIFTRLSDITRHLIAPDDDNILDYLNDDGMTIEPKFYAPVIPLVLVNGCHGIGTGYSTTVPNYNPVDIVANVRRMIKGEDPIDMIPYYRGFRGAIEFSTEGKTGGRYETKGIVTKIDETTLEVTELPIGTWTQNFKEMLVKMMTGTASAKKSTAPQIEDFKENHTDTTVHFTIYLSEAQMKAAEEKGLEKFFKLSTNLTISNMTLFSHEGKIKTYSDTKEILKEFYQVRLNMYEKRKEFLVNKLQREFDILDNKVRFILAVINDEIIIRKKKKAELLKELQKKGFKAFPKETKKKTAKAEQDQEEEDDEEADSTEKDPQENSYNYLLSMPLWSLTMERVQELEKQKADKHAELKKLQETPITTLWERDLENVVERLKDFEEAAKLAAEQAAAMKGKQSTSKTRKPAARKKKVKDETEDATEKSEEKPKKKAGGRKKKTDDEVEEKKPAKKTKKKDESEEEVDMMEVDEEEAELPTKKPEAATTKKKTLKANKDALKLDSDDDDIPMGSLAERLAGSSTKKESDAKPVITSPSPKKPAAKRRKVEVPKSKPITDFFKKTKSEDNQDTEKVEEPAKPLKSSQRATKKKDAFVVDDDDDEQDKSKGGNDSEEEVVLSDEEEKKPSKGRLRSNSTNSTKSTKSAAVTDDEEEEEAEIGDDEEEDDEHDGDTSFANDESEESEYNEDD